MLHFKLAVGQSYLGLHQKSANAAEELLSKAEVLMTRRMTMGVSVSDLR